MLETLEVSGGCVAEVVDPDTVRDEWQASPWYDRIEFLTHPLRHDEERQTRLIAALLRNPAQTERMLLLMQEYVSRISRHTQGQDTSIKVLRLGSDPHLCVDVWSGLFNSPPTETPRWTWLQTSIHQDMEVKYGFGTDAKFAWEAFHDTAPHAAFPPHPLNDCIPRYLASGSPWDRLGPQHTRHLFRIACLTYSHVLRQCGVLDPYEPLADLLALDPPLAVTRVRLTLDDLAPLQHVSLSLHPDFLTA